jgi:hypothetical protein
MNTTTKFFFLGLIALGTFQLSSSLAFHEPGHIPPTGTCREPSCMEPPKDGDKPKDTPKDKPCDDKLLKELKAKRDQKIKAYREIVAAAEETRQREAEAIAEAQKIFGDYAKSIVEKGVVKVGKEVYKVPDEVVAAYKEAKIYASDKPASEKFLKLTKLYLETLAKDAGYKGAVERAKWIETAVSGALMDAMVLSKLKEAETLAEAAYNQWLRGYEALMEARHLEDRIRKLEAQCKAKGGKSGSSPSEEADSRSSGEREADEAQKMLDSWKKVDGGFEDSEGNFHDADMAFEEALSIVQSQQSSPLQARPFLASLSSIPSPLVVAEMSDAQMQAEWAKYREPLRRAFEAVVKAMETYHRTEQEFYLIGGGPAGAGKPASSGSSRRK